MFADYTTMNTSGEDASLNRIDVLKNKTICFSTNQRTNTTNECETKVLARNVPVIYSYRGTRFPINSLAYS